jgi:hypothetical protein
VKRTATGLVAILAIAVASQTIATSAAENAHQSTHSKPPIPARCTVQTFRPFSAAVWRLRAWERGKPPAKAMQAERRRLGCAPGHHRKAMKRTWRRDRARYGKYRELRQIAPYPGYVGRGLASRWLAIPRYIVDCESNGDWFAMNASGASYLYQLLGWGAPYPDDWRAKMENHRIASEVWAGGAGASNWVCA